MPGRAHCWISIRPNILLCAHRGRSLTARTAPTAFQEATSLRDDHHGRPYKAQVCSFLWPVNCGIAHFLRCQNGGELPPSLDVLGTEVMVGVREAPEDISLRFSDDIGRAHVCTPVTNAHLVCRLLLEKKK